MAVRCGNCKGEHASKQGVRDCYYNATIDQEDETIIPVGETPVWPPSNEQLDYLRRLLAERNWPHEYSEQQIKAMDRSEVGALISGLTQATYKVGKKPDRWQIPEGKYALETEDDIEFYKVDAPTEGKWKGYTFAKRLYGAPGEWAEQRLRYDQAERVLEEIQKDPAAASVRFGKHYTVCGVCGSPLSRPESRAAGIGPKCRANLGW